MENKDKIKKSKKEEVVEVSADNYSKVEKEEDLEVKKVTPEKPKQPKSFEITSSTGHLMVISYTPKNGKEKTLRFHDSITEPFSKELELATVALLKKGHIRINILY